MTTVGTLSWFQEFFLQPIVKDRPNNSRYLNQLNLVFTNTSSKISFFKLLVRLAIVIDAKKPFFTDRQSSKLIICYRTLTKLTWGFPRLVFLKANMKHSNHIFSIAKIIFLLWPHFVPSLDIISLFSIDGIWFIIFSCYFAWRRSMVYLDVIIIVPAPNSVNISHSNKCQLHSQTANYSWS